MKYLSSIVACALSITGFAQTTKLFVESSVGAASISSNNTQVIDRQSSPMMRTAIGYNQNNIRAGVCTARSDYGFSTST
jgi:hypothetical protein